MANLSLPEDGGPGQPSRSPGIVTASELNVRSGPSTGKPRVGALSRGTQVEILEQKGRWYRIRTAAVEGFVYGAFIRLLDGDPPAGFLKDQDALLALPLEEPESRRLRPKTGASAGERLLARIWNEQGGLLQPVSRNVGIDPGAAVAVVAVESGGRSFSAGGRMIIRFEAHVFLRQWGKGNQGLFDAHFRFHPAKPWMGHVFRSGPGGEWRAYHGTQELEWEVFTMARGMNEPAALRSISMGAPQIMGFNFARIGYDSVAAMFEAFESGLRSQLLGFFDFVKGSGTTSAMLQALQRRQFAEFATLYNGPGQAAEYGERLERDFESFLRLSESIEL